MAYKVLDIFSGAGGMSHGVAKAGFKILQAVDVDADALASLKMNHPNTIIERKAVSWLGLHAPAAFDWIGFKPDVVIGGPPCQGYSDAGRRDRNDPRAYRYHDFARIIRKYRPSAFILENVDSVVTIHRGEIFADMRRVLAEPG
jgi:DNA (cytosine-5)-methyltransferase 1